MFVLYNFSVSTACILRCRRARRAPCGKIRCRAPSWPSPGLAESPQSPPHRRQERRSGDVYSFFAQRPLPTRSHTRQLDAKAAHAHPDNMNAQQRKKLDSWTLTRKVRAIPTRSRGLPLLGNGPAAHHQYHPHAYTRQQSPAPALHGRPLVEQKGKWGRDVKRPVRPHEWGHTAASHARARAGSDGADQVGAAAVAHVAAPPRLRSLGRLEEATTGSGVRLGERGGFGHGGGARRLGGVADGLGPVGERAGAGAGEEGEEESEEEASGRFCHK